MVNLPPFRRSRPIGTTSKGEAVYFDPAFTRDFFEPLARAADEGAEVSGGFGYVYTIAERSLVSALLGSTTAQRQSATRNAITASRQAAPHNARTAPRTARCAAHTIARRT